MVLATSQLISRIEPMLEARLSEHKFDVSKGSKVLRDSLWGFHNLSPYALIIIDSPIFQRLRHLFQTAMALHTYPCAVHSRFEHSLGVAHLTERMLTAIERNTGEAIPQKLRIETYLAGLLHDISHGPFSHASEDLYGRDPIFDAIRKEDQDRFGSASPSEIQAWGMLHSEPFRRVWNEVESAAGVQLDVHHVSDMILGSSKSLPDEYAYLKEIINGPFDADKLDYLSRDGYFTGLQIAVDTERLFGGLSLWQTPEGKRGIAVDASASSALEQVIFAKSQLFNQLYHHHKVRASARVIQRLLEELSGQSCTIRGHKFTDHATYLDIDEYDVLGATYSHKSIVTLVDDIKYRRLPKRAAILGFSSIESNSLADWGIMRTRWRKSLPELHGSERSIAERAGVPIEQVMIDVPAEAKLQDTGSATVRLGESEYIPLESLFPANGWANAHKHYRSLSCVFTNELSDTGRKKVGTAVREHLLDHDINTRPNALTMAKPRSTPWLAP